MIFKKGEKIDLLSKKGEVLERQPHVSLFKTSPPPSVILPQSYQKNQSWYVCLNWTEQHPGEEIGGQANLSDWLFYPQAFSEAIRQAKRLNVPAVKYNSVDILWAPTGESTPEQKKSIRELQGKK